jgi:hypothetical protein
MDEHRWLPPGKRAAVCLSVDDVHPASDVGQLDGGRARRALDHVRWLADRHPSLRTTLFVTPDWRSMTAYPQRSWWTTVPAVGTFAYHLPVLPPRTMRLERFPEFCEYLRTWTGVEMALHGLHHVTRGPQPLLEYDQPSVRRCRTLLTEGLARMDEAALPTTRGVCPPGWVASSAMLQAMGECDFRFIASARDLDTPIADSAKTAGSGLRGMRLIHPQLVPGTRLVHLPTNFQATSSRERAIEIVRAGGLLSIKAHLLDSFGSYVALDGLTVGYRTHLDDVLRAVEDECGDALWWPLMSEVGAPV